MAVYLAALGDANNHALDQAQELVIIHVKLRRLSFIELGF
jgi:hypothetical protein